MRMVDMPLSVFECAMFHMENETNLINLHHIFSCAELHECKSV